MAYAAVLSLLSAAYFSNTPDLGMDMHDGQNLRDNIAISQDWRFFFSAKKEQRTGRPLAELVKYIGYVVWGNNPAISHILVVVVHTLSSFLLGMVAYRLNAGRWAALMAGMLFLANVGHSYAVQHISAVDYPLSVLLMLFGLLCYERHLSEGRYWGWGAYAGVLLSPLAHAATGFLWPIFPLLAWVRAGRAALRPLLPLMSLLILEMVLLAVIAPGHTSTGRGLRAFATAEVAESAQNVTSAGLWLLGRLLTTAHWIVVPMYKQVPADPFIGAAVGLVLVALVYRRKHPACLWAHWSLLGIAPFLLLAHGRALGGDVWDCSRYLYLSSVGTSVLLACLLSGIGSRLGPCKGWFQGIALVGLLASSYPALKQTEALYLYSASRSQVAEGNIGTGVDMLKQALQKADGPNVINRPLVHTHIVFLTIGDRSQKYLLYGALQKYPHHPTLNLLRVALRSVDADPAVSGSAWQQAKLLRDAPAEMQIEVAPDVWVLARHAKTDVAAAYHKLGNGFRANGEPDRAVMAYKRSLMFRPNHPQTLQALADLSPAT